MNNVECKSCVKRKTMYCPNSFKCYATKNKPYWQNRIMLLEENEQLKKELQKADSLTQSCIFEGKEESELNFRKAINVIKQLRSWLEEEINQRCSKYERWAFDDCLNKLNELEGIKYEKV